MNEVWTPAGTTGHRIPARDIKPTDQVLVHKAHGFWGLSSANPDCTPRHSVWATVVHRVRRNFDVKVDGSLVTVSVRLLDHPVIRRTNRLEVAAQEIMTLAASGRHDAVDLALECAFPSGPSMETVRDKVNGHLEAAEAVFSVAYARGGHKAEAQALGALEALRALKADLGF